RGAVVVEVVPESVADDIGLAPGDVITAVNGVPVEGSRSLRNRIGTMRPGSEIQITVQQGSEAETLRVVLRSSGDGAPAGAAPGPSGTMQSALAGVIVTNMAPEHPAYGKVEGVVIASVVEESAAARAGLRAGDAITHVDRQPVTSKAAFDARIAAAGDTIALTIWRDGRSSLIIIERDA
uniref:PDZ domain-containing protein n=1 Tax=Yoonia sp. TaxID=2212373 RepID=UPI003F6CCB53